MHRPLPKYTDLLLVEIGLPQTLAFFAVSTELHVLRYISYISLYTQTVGHSKLSHHNGRSNVFSRNSAVFSKPHVTFYCMLFVIRKKCGRNLKLNTELSPAA